jgi:hypothetical protein
MFETANAAYYDSDERRAMDPDPARLLVGAPRTVRLEAP